MKSPKNTLYWTQVSSIAEEVLRATNEWLVPHDIDDVDLLHRLGDDKESVVNHFSMLQLAMLKAAEIHGVSESETTADIWNLMTQEYADDITSNSTLPKPH
jgi:hypothetical protein